MKGDFTKKNKLTLAKRAGEKCLLCGIGTSKPHSKADNFVNLGEASHIKGNKEGKFNRYDPTLSDVERSKISNGIWLCITCHRKIDRDDRKYTVAFLKKVKEEHENRIESGFYDQKFPDYDQQQRVQHDQRIFNTSTEIFSEVNLNILLDDIKLNKLIVWQHPDLKRLDNYLDFHNLKGNRYLNESLNSAFSTLRYSINGLLLVLYNVPRRENEYDVLFRRPSTLIDSLYIGMKPPPKEKITLLYDQNKHNSYCIKYDIISKKVDQFIDDVKSSYSAYRQLIKTTIYV